MNDIEKFWKDKTSSLNREGGENFNLKKAIEHSSVLGQLDPSDHILDIACGAGELLEYLSIFIPISAGIDYSEAMIQSAKIRLNGKFNGELKQINIFTFLPSATQTVWMTTGGINQYLNASELKSIMNIFKNNKNVTSFYLFDCIDPLRYDLITHSISYRNITENQIGLGLKIKKIIKRFFFTLGFLVGKYEQEVTYLGRAAMGFGQRPSFWIKIGLELGLKVEIVSSRYYEYRYHVIFKKS